MFSILISITLNDKLFVKTFENTADIDNRIILTETKSKTKRGLDTT